VILDEKMNNIKQIFKNFKSYEPKSNDNLKFFNILTGNYNPPSYIVQILFLNILNFRNYGRIDKVLWHTYFQYKNYPFMIRDYKFGSWSIEGIQNSNEIFKIVKEIQNKIIKASKILDKCLLKELKNEIERENFYLNNVYQKIFSIYNFYEKKVLEAIEEYDKLEENINFKKNEKNILDLDVLDYINTKTTYEKTISNFSFALIQSFFSLLEFLLNAIFIFEQFEQRDKNSFKEFNEKDWKQKFKSVFPITNNKNKWIKKIYDELINIKDNYRNPLAHGFMQEENLLIPISPIGLIPISYEYLSKKIHYRLFEINKEEALKIINKFDNFFKFLEEEKPYKFYKLYIEYSFPIPNNKKLISEIKREMISYEYFKEYLNKRAEYEDMIVNRDI
jgi:hypothetical protein